MLMYLLNFSFIADFGFTAVCNFTAIIYGLTAIYIIFGYFNFLGMSIGLNWYDLSAEQA